MNETGRERGVQESNRGLRGAQLKRREPKVEWNAPDEEEEHERARMAEDKEEDKREGAMRGSGERGVEAGLRGGKWERRTKGEHGNGVGVLEKRGGNTEGWRD